MKPHGLVKVPEPQEVGTPPFVIEHVYKDKKFGYFYFYAWKLIFAMVCKNPFA